MASLTVTVKLRPFFLIYEFVISTGSKLCLKFGCAYNLPFRKFGNEIRITMQWFIVVVEYLLLKIKI